MAGIRFCVKNGLIDYVTINIENPTRKHITHGRAQRNHIFLASASWFRQHKRHSSQKITLYQQNSNVIEHAIQQQIKILISQAV